LKRFADAIVRFREMTPEAREEAKPRRDEQIRRTKEKLDEGQPAASGLEDRADPLARVAPPPPPLPTVPPTTHPTVLSMPRPPPLPTVPPTTHPTVLQPCPTARSWSMDNTSVIPRSVSSVQD
jgi:hypothetical protein